MPSPALPSEVWLLLNRLTPAQRRLVLVLRALIRRTAPQTRETVLWGSLSYHRPSLGGRIKGAVCLVTPKTDAVHLGFIHGAALPDPAHLLRGAAKSKRVVVIRHRQDVDRAALAALIRAAARHDPRGKHDRKRPQGLRAPR